MRLPRSALPILAVLCALCCGAAAAAELANGIFLIAKREMRDPRFQETVVLITQPPQGGPFGVIVNRPLERLLSEVFPEQAALKGKKDVVHLGGPVALQGLMFLVRGAKPPPVRAVPVLKDVHFVADQNFVQTLFKRPDLGRNLRVFAGYAGWGPGQLQNEIQRGDWHVLPADAETIFDKDPERIWPELYQRATSRPTRSLTPDPSPEGRGVQNAPFSPREKGWG